MIENVLRGLRTVKQACVQLRQRNVFLCLTQPLLEHLVLICLLFKLATQLKELLLLTSYRVCSVSS